MTITDYSDYTVRVTSEPSYYGSTCTDADAESIAQRIADMIREEFAGIVCTVSRNVEGPGITGPDEAIRDEILLWVDAHWTAAL